MIDIKSVMLISQEEDPCAMRTWRICGMVGNVLNGGLSYSRTVRMFYMCPATRKMARVSWGRSQGAVP
jgi:hypothetical protein